MRVNQHYFNFNVRQVTLWVFLSLFFFVGVPGYSQITVPVVVHNVHNGATGFMSDQQIETLISDLNVFYDRFNDPAFANPLDIEFVLAKVDPQGFCTDGIVNVNFSDPVGSIGIPAIDLQLKSLSRWPTNKYLNIWTVVSIDGGAAGGYAFTPTNVVNEFANPISFFTMDPDNQNASEALTDGVVIVFDESVVELAHEVGHWLNLKHLSGPDTFSPTSNWLMCHSNADCAVQGDFVCDTPPVDRSAGSVNCLGGVNTCTLDVPDLDDDHSNLMTWFGPCLSINSSLTDGQLDRMSDCLLNIRGTLIDPANLAETGVLSNIGSDIVVSFDETWTTSNLPNGGEVSVSGNITVTNGAKLTIDQGVVVNFCQGARLIVEAGSELVLDGSELTSLTSFGWEGIELQGNVSPSQSNTAAFRSFTGSKISNALIGIRNYGPATAQSGSRIQADGTEFVDNDISIDAAPNDGLTVLHTNSCTFTNNNNPDFEAFVRLRRVRGVIGFTGTDFIGLSTSSCLEGHGKGIASENSIFGVYGNSKFEGLGIGVSVESGTGSRPFFIEDNEFKNCYIGIYSNANGNFRIWENKFDMTSLPVTTVSVCSESQIVDDQVGIFLENNMVGADIQENEFLNSSPLNSVSIVASGLGPINNKVKSNNFGGEFGIVADGVNSTGFNPNLPQAINLTRGLFFSCNDFNSSSKCVVGNDVFRSLRNMQFTSSQGVLDRSAGNTWPAGPVHIENNSILPNSDILYFYDMSTTGEEPTVNTNVTTEDTDAASCPNEVNPPGTTGGQGSGGGIMNGGDVPGFPFTDPTTLPTLVSVHPVLQSDIDYVITVLDGLQNPTSQQLQDAQVAVGSLYEDDDQLISEIIALYQMYDNLWSETQYLYYLSEYESYVGDLIAVRYLCGTGQWSDASTLLQSIPTNRVLNTSEQADHARVVSLFNDINGDDVENYSASTVLDVIAHAEGDRGNSRGWARALLTYHDKSYMPTIDISTVRTRSRVSSSGQKSFDELSVAPNPAANSIIISLTGSAGSADLERVQYRVVDVLGKVYKSDLLRSSEIDISDLESGLYILEVTTFDDQRFSNKFIKI